MVCLSETKYIPELKKLWKLCFPEDSDVFIDFYFDEVYKNEETLVIVKNDQLIASLQMIPFPLKINQSISFAGYISGAMTHPDFRKKGYMEVLLKASFEKMKEKGFDYTFLIPQEKWLFDMYAKFGYEKAFPSESQAIIINSLPEEKSEKNILRDKEIHIFKSRKEVDINNFFIIYYRFLMENDQVILKTKPQLKKILGVFFDENGILFANDWGIAFVQQTENNVHIKEFFYFDPEIKTDFLKAIADYFSVEKVTCQTYLSSKTSNFYGMIKSLNDSVFPSENIYMSQMFD